MNYDIPIVSQPTIYKKLIGSINVREYSQQIKNGYFSASEKSMSMRFKVILFP